jgi:peptidylprolyl isomerase
VRAKAALVAALLLTVSACGDDSPKPTRSGGACEAGGTGTTDLTKKPELPKASDKEPKDTTIVDVVCGAGEEAKVGSRVVLKYVGATLKDGNEFGSTWRDDTTTTVKVGTDVIQGFTTGLVGMKVGGRRLVTIPPKDGFGDQQRGPIPPNSTLVFVLDLVEIKPPPARTPCTPSGKGSTDLTKKPGVAPHPEPPPTETTFTDIVCGDGAQAEEGSNVTVQYVGTLYSGGKEFDASWGKGQPFPFTVGEGVVPGFSIGVTGMKEGGRREIVIPAKDGYGAEGRPPSIPPNSVLVFVIDLVKVSEA